MKIPKYIPDPILTPWEEKQEKLFKKWLWQFIKEQGHDFLKGFYVVLNNGKYLSGREYFDWMENKITQYKNSVNYIL